MSRKLLVEILAIVFLIHACMSPIPFLPTAMSAYDSFWVDDLKLAADNLCPGTNCANEDFKYIKYIRRMSSNSWEDYRQGYVYQAASNVMYFI